MRETELVERFAAGDREAFDALYELYKDQAFRTAWFLAGNRADAEDIVQDTFVKVYVNIGQLKDAGGFKSWFYRILTRTAWKQSEGRRREFPDSEILTHADASSDTDRSDSRLLKEEERQRIRDAVDRLDEKTQNAVILFHEFSTRLPASWAKA